MTAREAVPVRLSASVRRHWGIENKVHYVRSPPTLSHALASRHDTDTLYRFWHAHIGTLIGLAL